MPPRANSVGGRGGVRLLGSSSTLIVHTLHIKVINNSIWVISCCCGTFQHVPCTTRRGCTCPRRAPPPPRRTAGSGCWCTPWLAPSRTPGWGLGSGHWWRWYRCWWKAMLVDVLSPLATHPHTSPLAPRCTPPFLLLYNHLSAQFHKPEMEKAWKPIQLLDRLLTSWPGTHTSLATVSHFLAGTILHSSTGTSLHSSTATFSQTVRGSMISTSLQVSSGTVSHWSTRTVWHFCSGTSWHCSRTIFSHFSLGTNEQTSSGTLAHFCVGTFEQLSLVTSWQTSWGTVLHTCVGTCKDMNFFITINCIIHSIHSRNCTFLQISPKYYLGTCSQTSVSTTLHSWDGISSHCSLTTWILSL